MQSKLFPASVCAAFALFTSALTFASQPLATEQVIHAFTGGPDGAQPASGLTLNKAGNLYGSTLNGGGSANAGTIYKLSPNSGGGWTETVIYTFKGGTDGAHPYGRLLLGPKGQIVGATDQSGGVVFALIPSGTTYVGRLLHTFPAGYGPLGGLITDKSGNLYGLAAGGSYLSGVVYELTRTTTGYEYVVLYNFKGGTDGAAPRGELIFDRAGNLYGATQAGGGACGCGTVFELTKGTTGTWTESILFAFTSTSDGVGPQSGLAMDSSGNLFGTTLEGGDTSCHAPYGCGEVFELTNSGGVWTKSTIHAFTDTPDGNAPAAGVTFDAHGNLFGTTSNGGSSEAGVLYELSPTTGGWNESVLYSFTDGADGGYVETPVIFDSKGNLYGTAGFGGTAGDGVVYEFPGLGAQ